MIQSLRESFDRFFFAPQSLYNVSLFRLVLGCVLLWAYFLRFFGREVFFLSGGFFQTQDVAAFNQTILPSLFYWFVPDDMWIQFQLILQLVLLFGLVLGLLGRVATFVLFIVHVGLLQRNILIVYGLDLFATYFLFYLSFVKHSEHFSIGNWIRRKYSKSKLDSGNAIFDSDMFGSVGIRMIQLHLCLTYAMTGLEKLKGHTWWEGTALWYVIGMEDAMPYDLSFLKVFPILIGVMVYLTLIFEIYFPIAIWNKTLRPIWLLLGAFFHLNTGLFMGLPLFAFTMMSAYLLFIDESYLRSFFTYFRTRFAVK